MYNKFKVILAAAESIGKIETAELSDYKNGWVEVKGKTDSGRPFTLRLIVEGEDDDN